MRCAVSRWQLERKGPARAVWAADAREIAWQADDKVELAVHAEAARRALAAGGAIVDVIAAPDLAVHWVQQPPTGMRSLRELQLAAGARCAHLYGGLPADWWVAGNWSARRPFVCSALPHRVTKPLRDACAEKGMRLRWHSAWSVVCNARSAAFPDEGWSAMRTPRRVLLWHCRRGEVSAMSSLAVTPEASPSELEALVGIHRRLEIPDDGSAADASVHWHDIRRSTTRTQGEAEAALTLRDLVVR